MARLPNPNDAVVDVRKLRDYCLNPLHPRGRNKARVFASVLGLTANDAEMLREALISATITEEATLAEWDQYGQRYMLDFEIVTREASATVRSGWIVRHEEDFPRFTSCWIL